MDIRTLKESLVPFMMNEERGIYKQYEQIGEEVYDLIDKMKPTMNWGDVQFYRLINIRPSVDCFADSMNIECYVGYKKESSFDILKDVEHLSGNHKLKNFIIRIFLEKKNKNDFMENFCHEFHHAYRYHCIISKNNGELTKIEKDKWVDASTIRNGLKTSDRPEYNLYLRMLANILYLCNDNEMNAFTSEIYEYLRQHKEINQYNFTDKVEEFPVYKQYNDIAEVIMFLDKNNKDQDLIDAVKDVSSTILKMNVNERNCIMRFRQYLSHKLERFQTNFFKTAKKALYDLGKYGKQNENMIKELIITNQLREILRKYGETI